MNLQDMRPTLRFGELRPAPSDKQSIAADVLAIIEDVKTYGDSAVLKLTRKFDAPSLQKLRVSEEEIQQATAGLNPELKMALQRAITNQQIVQRRLLDTTIDMINVQTGITVWREWRPIKRVGLYVPGGLAAYPSTVIMNVVPAQIAGCQQIVITTPPNRNGSIDPVVLATAAMLGVTMVFKIGGAQAIAALAYGTESIERVDKLVGPGNRYVTTAKQLVSRDIAIDMPAGPSEVCIIADRSANPAWVAADMVAQCEHDRAAQAVVISTSAGLLVEVERAARLQISQLKTGSIAEESFTTTARFVLVNSLADAIILANDYAPEHLELQTADDKSLLPAIQNAGSVFVGPYSAEVLGDYASGSNHVLPTNGFARSYSGLSVDSFGKWIEFQAINPAGFQSIAPTVTLLAEAEGLTSHARAVAVRTEMNID